MSEEKGEHWLTRDLAIENNKRRAHNAELIKKIQYEWEVKKNLLDEIDYLKKRVAELESQKESREKDIQWQIQNRFEMEARLFPLTKVCEVMGKALKEIAYKPAPCGEWTELQLIDRDVLLAKQAIEKCRLITTGVLNERID